MSDVAFKVTLNDRRLTDISAGLLAAVMVGIDKALAQVEQDAAANTPYQTGGLRASRFRKTLVVNEYPSAVAALLARNPKAEVSPEPEVKEPGRGIVGFAAGYATPVHDGHHTHNGGWVPGNPFLAQAAEANRAHIAQVLKESLDKLIKG